MYTKKVFAVTGALLSVVAAVPMVKRDVVWVTETDEAIVTVPVTTTVWVNPGESVPTGAASHYGHKHRSTITSHVQSTVIVPAPSSTESPVESSSEAPSSYEAPTTSSVYVAPTTSSIEVAPTTPTTSAYVAPTTSSFEAAPTTPTTSAYVAPTTSTWVAPTTTSAAPAPSSTSSSSGSGSDTLTGAAAPGTSYTGDFTWYQDGLGACGMTNGPSDHIVAVAESLFDQYTPTTGIHAGNPNANPLCGLTVTLTGVDGSAYPATIVDRCTGCQESDLDLSQDFFNTVTDNGNGRVSGMSWKFGS